MTWTGIPKEAAVRVRREMMLTAGCFFKQPSDLHITNAPLGGGRITIDIAGSVASVHGLPEGMVFHRGHRPWMSELVAQADQRRKEARRPADHPPSG